MNELDLAIARKFNKDNPISEFDGMTKEEVDNSIMSSLIEGQNRIHLKKQYRKFSQLSLKEASVYVDLLIGKVSEIFYTGQASTPTSVGVKIKATGKVIDEVQLWTEDNTGAEIRHSYELNKKRFKSIYGL